MVARTVRGKVHLAFRNYTRSCANFLSTHANVTNRSSSNIFRTRDPTLKIHRTAIIGGLRRRVRSVQVNFFSFVRRWGTMQTTTSTLNRLANFIVTSMAQEQSSWFKSNVLFRMFTRIRTSSHIFNSRRFSYRLFNRFNLASANEPCRRRKASESIFATRSSSISTSNFQCFISNFVLASSIFLRVNVGVFRLHLFFFG